MSSINIKTIQYAKSVLFIFVIVIFGNFVIAAQQGTITGTWSSKSDDTSDKGISVRMSPENLRSTKKVGTTIITRSNEDSRENAIKIGDNGNTITFDRSELKSASLSSSGPVRFTVTREPGTFQFDGTANAGQATGRFTFTPNYGFIDAMRSRGFEVVGKSGSDESNTEESLYVAALFNISTRLADDLTSANLGYLKYGDLVKAAIFKIDGDFAMSIKAAGLNDVNMDQLTKARIFKIQPEDIRSMYEAGIGIKDFNDMVQYKIFKITPQFLNELRAEGLTDLKIGDVVKLSIFKIDASFVRQAMNEDPNISVSNIIKKKLHP